MNIYLDESGDLGWKFSAPYRFGGSSRHLTIASVLVSSESVHLPKRLIKKLYTKFSWPAKQEKKWSRMKAEERLYFASLAKALWDKNPGVIKYVSITVKKERVQEHIRRDPNKLYNYMIGRSLLDEMAKTQEVTFVPDPRSVKVESGNSLHDYLQTQLWFEKDVSTYLRTQPSDSAANRNVQFADMLSGVVQGHFEDANSAPWNELKACLEYQTLFFS